MRGFVGMAVRLAKLHPGALLLRTRSVDYSLLAKLRFLVPGGPWQGLEESPACTVTFSGASFSTAVGRRFAKVVAPTMFFLTSALTPAGVSRAAQGFVLELHHRPET